MSRNRVIGRGQALPWRIPSDLRHFKAVTLGKPVVMGRRTYESIGRPLPGRHNIVISATMAAQCARESAGQCDVAGDAGQRVHAARGGFTCCATVRDALALAAESARSSGVDEVCVIGGGQVYRAVMPFCQRVYLTRVQADLDGDTFFPPLEPVESWVVCERSFHPRAPGDDYSVVFERIERRRFRS